VVGYTSLRRLSITSRWVLHSRNVRSELKGAFYSLQDAETGQRGFLITGDPHYLAPYRTGRRVLPERLARLTTLTEDNPEQQRLLPELHDLVTARLAELRETITARRRAGVEAADRIVRSGHGKEVMDRIRELVENMIQNEDALLAQRTRDADAASFSAHLSFGLIALVALGGLALVYHLDRRQLRDAHALAEERGRAAETREQVAAILASASDAIITIDTDQRITLFNTAAERMFGCPASEVMGQSLDRFIPVAFHQRHRDHIRAFTETGVSSRVMGGERVLSAVRAGGEEFPIEAQISQAVIGGRKLLTVIVRDVTDRKRAEAEREGLLAITEGARAAAEAAAGAEGEARAVAEAASRAKDAFLATVSHELRTPLSPILAWARMLRQKDLDPEKATRAFEVIERCAKTQAQLIEDLLDVSRIISGKMRLEVRPVTLAPVIEKAVDVVRPAADAKSVRVLLVLDTEVGAVLGDPERLQQVVWNLVSNAIKFTPKGGRIQVALERVNSHVEIAVSDTGPGIAPEFLPRVFERFQQADVGAARAHGGLGLGLAIVRHIVEAHGGTVHAESPGLGQGAVFTVKLPLMTARTAGEAERRHPAAGPPTDGSRMPRLDGLRLLVVDDEPDANDVVQSMLVSRGAEVRVAGSAPHARDILLHWKPDVLVSDVGMPGEDGYALIGSLHVNSDDAVAQIPAVALTAYASREDKVRLLSAGFQAHVPKPVDPDELIAVIASLGRVVGKL
jgi:PAS domain S-box-containing protein